MNEYVQKQQQLQTTIQMLQQQIKESKGKIDKLARLHTAIVQLYCEFRDRTADELAGKAAEPFERLMEEDALIILDKLRSQLRVLLNFKDDFERQLKSGIDQKTRQNDNSAQIAAGERYALQQELYSKDQELRLEKAKNETNDKNVDEMKAIHRNEVLKLSEQKASLEVTNRTLKSKLDEQEETMKQVDKLLKERDVRLGRISELEAKMAQQAIKKAAENAKEQTMLNKRNIDLTMKLQNYDKTCILADQLQLENKKLQDQINSYKRNHTVRELQEIHQERDALSKQFDELNQQFRSLADEHQKTVSELQIVKIQYEQSKNDLVMQKTQFAFSPMQFQQQKIKQRDQLVLEKEKLENKQTISDHNIQSYKERIREKDKEIEELANRVRKLLALQHKSNLSQKAFQEEKQHMELQMTSMRDEITALRKTVTLNPVEEQHKSHQTINELLLRDTQNLRTMAATASAAFQAIAAPEIQLNKREREDPYLRIPGLHKLQEVDDIMSKKQAVRPSTAQVATPGRGVGYGAGYMLGGTRQRSARPTSYGAIH